MTGRRASCQTGVTVSAVTSSHWRPDSRSASSRATMLILVRDSPELVIKTNSPPRAADRPDGSGRKNHGLKWRSSGGRSRLGVCWWPGRHRSQAAGEKAAITAACEKLIAEELRPRFLPEVRPSTTFNYPVAIEGKWLGNKYRFFTRYRSDDPASLKAEFDARPSPAWTMSAGTVSISCGTGTPVNGIAYPSVCPCRKRCIGSQTNLISNPVDLTTDVAPTSRQLVAIPERHRMPRKPATLALCLTEETRARLSALARSRTAPSPSRRALRPSSCTWRTGATPTKITPQPSASTASGSPVAPAG